MTMTEDDADKWPFKQSPFIYGAFRYDAFRVWHSKTAHYARMRPDDRRGKWDADDTMAKEKAMMKARAPKDNVMTTQMLMRNKKFRMQFVVAEVMRVDMAGTKSWMQAVSAKGCMEAARLAQALSEVAWLRMADAPRSPCFTRRNFDKGKRQESKTDKTDAYPFHYSRTRLGGSEKPPFCQVETAHD
jgi:hypothetical protein